MAGLVELYPRVPFGVSAGSVSTTVADVKSPVAGGWLIGGNAYNPHASDIAFVQFFDADAADVTLGTTVPVFTVAVPAGQSVSFDIPRPIRCSTGMSYAAASTRLGAVAPTSAISLWLSYV